MWGRWWFWAGSAGFTLLGVLTPCSGEGGRQVDGGGQPGPVGALGKPRDAGRSRGEAKCKAWTWTWGGGVRDFSRWGVLAPQSWGEPETPAFLFFTQQSAKLGACDGRSTCPPGPGTPLCLPRVCAPIRLPCSDPWCSAPPADLFGKQQGLTRAPEA